MTLSLDMQSIAAIRAALASRVADARATFECSFTGSAPDVGFYVFAGLDPLLELLEDLQLSQHEVQSLTERELLDEASAERLSRLRLSCDIDAVAEGTPVFPGVPVFSVDGPFWQVELVASLACKVLGRATRVATQTARYALAIAGSSLGSRPLLELGGEEGERGASEARLSRAAYLGGATATTSSSGAIQYELPSYVRYGSHTLGATRDHELDLESWLAAAPRGAMFTLDEHDSSIPLDRLAAAVARVAKRSWSEPRFALELSGGDAIGLSLAAERAFRDYGLPVPPLFVRSQERELALRELAGELPAEVGFAIDPHAGNLATRMKAELVAIEEEGRWTPRMRYGSSLQDTSDPGRKKPLRYSNPNGAPQADIAYAANERTPSGQKPLTVHDARTGQAQTLPAAKGVPLLGKVMRGGQRLETPHPLETLRARAIEQITLLPQRYRRLHAPARYPVGISAALLELKIDELAVRS